MLSADILALTKYELKFIYSEKATKFCEISTLLLSTVHTDKIKVEILQNFVAFLEYMNFIKIRFSTKGKVSVTIQPLMKKLRIQQISNSDSTII